MRAFVSRPGAPLQNPAGRRQDELCLRPTRLPLRGRLGRHLPVHGRRREPAKSAERGVVRRTQRAPLVGVRACLFPRFQATQSLSARFSHPPSLSLSLALSLSLSGENCGGRYSQVAFTFLEDTRRRFMAAYGQSVNTAPCGAALRERDRERETTTTRACAHARVSRETATAALLSVFSFLFFSLSFPSLTGPSP